jgi:capsular exopolysaccharide synthesis family protein
MTTLAPKPQTPDRPAQRPSAPVVQAGARIDPIRVLRQNQWKIVTGLVIGLFLGAVAKVVFDQVYPLYSGTVLFELRATVTNPDDAVAADMRGEEAVERVGQTEAARLVGRGLLDRAIKASIRDIERTKWADGFRDPNGQFVAEEAIDELEKDLNSSYRRRTQYFALTWQANNAEDIPVVLNAIANFYIQDRKVRDDERYAQIVDVYERNLRELDRNLAGLASDIGDFITQNNITSLRDVASDIVQRMEDTGKRINETKGQLSIAQSRKSQTDAKLQGSMEPSSEDVRQAEEDPVMMRVNSTVKDVRINAEIARQKFGTTHPEYRNAMRTVEAAELERDAELKKILNRNLTADLKLYGDQAEGLAKLLADYEADFAKLETRLKEFTAANAELEQKRDQQTRLQEQRSKLLDLITQVNALKLREDARAVTIAQPALTPREKSFPRWTVMVPLGGMLGLVLVLGVAFLREFLDQRVRYTSDLVGMSGRLLGVVPDVEDDPTGVKKIENVIRDAPQSVVSESLRQTTAHLQKHLKGHRSLLVVGGLPGAGVTAVVTNIADSIASSGKRVLLVDADFRRPSLASAMGAVPDQKGFGDVLGGACRFEDAVQKVTDTVHLVCAGTIGQRVFERLATASTDEFLAKAREQYDLVIIDAPPAIVAGDAMVLAAKVDATVLVVRAFQEQRGLVARLCSQLNDMPSQFIGIVFNRPRYTAGGYFRKNYEVMAGYANPK